MELYEYIQKGGSIMYILIFLNIVGFTIMGWKIMVLFITKIKKERISSSISDLIIRQNIDKNDSSILLKAISDEIYSKIKSLEFGLITIRIIASIAPLLGLLGTVLGIANAFESIGVGGLGDPKIFANHISLALVTTIGGLIVAIPHYIGYNYIIGFLDSLEIDIEKRVLNQINGLQQ